MQITTKYNLGQEVWFMKDNEIKHASIYDIPKIQVLYSGRGGYGTGITYGFNSLGEYPEDRLFPTKEELIKSL